MTRNDAMTATTNPFASPNAFSIGFPRTKSNRLHFSASHSSCELKQTDQIEIRLRFNSATQPQPQHAHYCCLARRSPFIGELGSNNCSRFFKCSGRRGHTDGDNGSQIGFAGQKATRAVLRALRRSLSLQQRPALTQACR